MVHQRSACRAGSALCSCAASCRSFCYAQARGCLQALLALYSNRAFCLQRLLLLHGRCSPAHVRQGVFGQRPPHLRHSPAGQDRVPCAQGRLHAGEAGAAGTLCWPGRAAQHVPGAGAQGAHKRLPVLHVTGLSYHFLWSAVQALSMHLSFRHGRKEYPALQPCHMRLPFASIETCRCRHPG